MIVLEKVKAVCGVVMEQVILIGKVDVLLVGGVSSVTVMVHKLWGILGGCNSMVVLSESYKFGGVRTHPT